MTLYSGKAELIKQNWTILKYCLIQLLLRLRRPKDPVQLQLVDTLASASESESDTLVLWLLPTMLKKPSPIPPTIDGVVERGRKRKNAEDSERISNWNPTTAEIQRGFLFHIEAENKRTEAVERVKRWMAEKKITFQPRPVIVGPLKEIRGSYIQLNDICYSVQSPLDAVLTLSQIFFALNIKYPPEARSAWLLIQKIIFDIDSFQEQSFPTSLITLISEIRSIYEGLCRAQN